MIVRVYDWAVNGEDGNKNEWQCKGTIMDSFVVLDFPRLMEIVVKETFQQLTQGKAVYGHPGKLNCRGPYKYKVIVITLKDELVAEDE